MKRLLLTLALALSASRATASPDALTLAPLSASLVAVSFIAAPFHSADINGNSRIDLTELLRVIELYNTRNGTVRTGAYAPDDTNAEDGFNIDAVRAPGAAVTLTRYHSADSDHNGFISLPELLRVIELYEYRVTTSAGGINRTGQYHVDPSTDDGFASGPAAAPAPPLPVGEAVTDEPTTAGATTPDYGARVTVAGPHWQN